MDLPVTTNLCGTFSRLSVLFLFAYRSGYKKMLRRRKEAGRGGAQGAVMPGRFSIPSVCVFIKDSRSCTVPYYLVAFFSVASLGFWHYRRRESGREFLSMGE